MLFLRNAVYLHAKPVGDASMVVDCSHRLDLTIAGDALRPRHRTSRIVRRIRSYAAQRCRPRGQRLSVGDSAVAGSTYDAAASHVFLP